MVRETVIHVDCLAQNIHTQCAGDGNALVLNTFQEMTMRIIIRIEKFIHLMLCCQKKRETP
jgi:hypothetical protein